VAVYSKALDAITENVNSSVVPHTYSTNYEADPWMMKNVGCYGWESHLLDCSYSSDTDAEDCNVAGVYCVPGEATGVIYYVVTYGVPSYL